jgi:hypothetical protein
MGAKLGNDTIMATQMSEVIWTVDANTVRIARAIPKGSETAAGDEAWQCQEQTTDGEFHHVKWAGGSREFKWTLTSFLAASLTYSY